MTPHNHAQPGDYAEAVLLPGDPLRAKWIAETFLDDPKLVNSVRNCLGYTGTWKGKRVSVQATGMGQPSTAIYVHELINVYGARTLIRVGTCGGLNKTVKVRDVVSEDLSLLPTPPARRIAAGPFIGPPPRENTLSLRRRRP